jgi:hypothetical protein
MEAQKIDLNKKLLVLCKEYMAALSGAYAFRHIPCATIFVIIYLLREKAVKHRAAHFKDLTHQPLVHNDQID